MTILIVQARIGSTRLPKKMLLDLFGKPLLQRVLERVGNCTLADKLIVAIPDTAENDVLLEIIRLNGFSLFRGNEVDVLDRVYQAAINLCDNLEDETTIIRVCADNPFVDPDEIDRLIGFFLKGNYDYAFNHLPALDNMYPNGLGAEALRFSILKYLWEKAIELPYREHLTKYIWDNIEKFKVGVLPAPSCIRYPEIKLDVDTQEDFQRAQMLYKRLIEKEGERIFAAAEVITEARGE